MQKTHVYPKGAPLPAGPYTPAIRAGGFLFVSGQTPKKSGTSEVVSGGIQAQTRTVLENLQSILIEAGCSMADVVKVNVHLANMADFGAVNEIYAEYFPEPYPTRTTVQSGLGAGYLVEIDAVAILPQ